MTSAAPQQSVATASGSFEQIVVFMREEREEAKADRAEMEAKLERQRSDMETKLEQQRTQMEARLDAKDAKIEQLVAPQEAVSAEQVSALTARLAALHAAQALSDDELFAVEDCIADFLEAKGSFDLVTMDVVNASRAMGKVHKLVLLSEGLPDDAMLARQLRRKFV